VPNPWTGDFEAVLQVSGRTIDRLLASMHQHAFATRKVPSLPHAAVFRFGDEDRVDGVVGRVRAQIGAPRLELVHGSSHRFGLEVGVRARFTPDPGSAPFPQWIHGTVRAEYRFEDVDPDCPGWRSLADEYIWTRLVDGSVTFAGTAEDDDGFALGGGGATSPATLDAVTRQIAALLAGRFAAVPHRVGAGFRPGRMRGLNQPGRGSAVAIPFALVTGLAGSMASLDDVWLDGRDFGIAISKDVILGRVQSALDDAVEDLKPQVEVRLDPSVGAFGVEVELPTLYLDYRTRLTSATAEWAGGTAAWLGLSAALVTITVHGVADTDTPLLDLEFDLVSTIVVQFNAAAQSLSAVATSPDITVHGGGPLENDIEDAAAPAIANAFKSVVGDPSAALGLGGIQAGRDQLVAELKRLDPGADVRLTEGSFSADGVLLRGRVSVTPRRRPVMRITKTWEGDAFSALESWLPGGRVDRFSWSWRWFNGGGPPGSAELRDRFVLHRQAANGGAAGALRRPLPGLDGAGRVCLTISGVQMHPVTGEWVPVESRVECLRYGLDILVRPSDEMGRLFWRDLDLGAVVEVTPGPRPRGTNTLVVHLGASWDEDVARVLRVAMGERTRGRGGLAVVVLVDDGRLAGAGDGPARELAQAAEALGLPVVLTEDVDGAWARGLAVRGHDGGPAWRLLAPGGGITWLHDGRLEPAALGHEVARHLVASGPPRPSALGLAARPGDRLPDLLLGRAPCPPVPVGRLAVGSVVGFVRRGAGGAEHVARLREAAHAAPGDLFAALVVDGSDPEEVAALRDQAGPDVAVMPDPAGALARSFGVRVWPTTVTLEPGGIVAAVRTGAEAAREVGAA
jgi:hypothetical protein